MSTSDAKDLAETFQIPESDPLRDMMEFDRSPHTIDERLRACMLFQITGSSKKVAKLTGIPDSTIRFWKTQSDWWPEASRQARKQHQEQLDAMMTGVIHQSIQELNDRLHSGNTKVLKDGSEKQVPLSSDELVRITDKVYDKRALNRGDPTQRTERVDVNDMLTNLFHQFSSMVEQHGRPASIIDASNAEDAEYTTTETETDNYAQKRLSETSDKAEQGHKQVQDEENQE